MNAASFRRNFFALQQELHRLGSQMLMAAVAKGLEEASVLTQEIDQRVRKGAAKAAKMAEGDWEK